MARKIVVFSRGMSEAAQDALIQRFGGRSLRRLDIIHGMAVLLPPRAVAAIQASPGVVRVEDDLQVTALPKPPGKGKGPKPKPTPAPETLPWGVDRVDAELAWGESTGANVRVAIIDSGIDKDHPDLAVAGGRNVANGRPNNWNDKCGHGTLVAGTVAALDNEIGVIGVAPGADLYAVRVLNRSCSGWVSDLIAGLQWSMDNNMQVINMSLGLGSDVQSLHDAIIAAHNQGIVLVAAAGNDGPGDDTVDYPAKYPEVIAVSATDPSDAIATFSSRGPEVELAAPGVNILSTWVDRTYRQADGTSMASPHVAGTAALIIAANPGLSADGVRTALRSTADDLGVTGRDDLYGYGLADAEEAVTGVETNP